MKLEVANHTNVDAIQKQFGYFAKRTLNNIIRKVLEKYADERKRDLTVSWETLEDLPAPKTSYDIEKVKVQLANCNVRISDEKLAKGLAKLKKRHKRIVELFFFLDMPYDAICELTALELKSVENYKSEAIHILKKYLEEGNDERRKG